MDRAIHHFERAAALGPAEKIALAYSNLCMTWIRKGELEKALRYCEDVNLMAPDYRRHYFFQAQAYYKLGNKGKAIEFYERTIAPGPYAFFQWQAANNLGSIYMANGDWHNAKKYFEIALELEPGAEPSQTNLKSVLRRLHALDTLHYPK